jgi:hypothetical protein
VQEKKMNLLKILAQKEWRGGSEDTPLDTPNGCLVDIYRYGQTMYGSASKSAPLVDENEIIDLIMCTIPKEVCKERIKAKKESKQESRRLEISKYFISKLKFLKIPKSWYFIKIS